MSTQTHSVRLIAQVCDRADAMLDRVEAMIGRPATSSALPLPHAGEVGAAPAAPGEGRSDG